MQVSINDRSGWLKGELLSNLSGDDCVYQSPSPENFFSVLNDVGTGAKLCSFIGSKSLRLKYLDKLILNTNNQKIGFNKNVFSACFYSLMRLFVKYNKDVSTETLPYFVNLFKDISSKQLAYSIIEKYCKESASSFDVSKNSVYDSEFHYCGKDFLKQFLFTETEIQKIQDLFYFPFVHKNIEQCKKRVRNFGLPFESENLAVVTLLPGKLKVLKIIKGNGDLSVDYTTEITGKVIFSERKAPEFGSTFIVPFYKLFDAILINEGECILENTESNIKEWLSMAKKDNLVPFNKKSCVDDIDKNQPWYEIYESKLEGGLKIRIKAKDGTIIEKKYGTRLETCDEVCPDPYVVLKIKKIDCKNEILEMEGIEGKVIYSLGDGRLFEDLGK